MHRYLLLSALVLSTILIGPALARADDASLYLKRYYARDGRDCHASNSIADRACRAYFQEQHWEYRDFNKVKPVPQRHFTWRSDHPPYELFKLEIR